MSNFVVFSRLLTFVVVLKRFITTGVPLCAICFHIWGHLSWERSWSAIAFPPFPFFFLFPASVSFSENLNFAFLGIIFNVLRTATSAE